MVETHPNKLRHTQVLGTEAHFGIGRLSANRPKNAFGFRLFEGNNRNRNRNRNRKLSGRLFDGIFKMNVLFCAKFAPPWKKKRIFQVRVSRHIGISPYNRTTCIARRAMHVT